MRPTAALTTVITAAALAASACTSAQTGAAPGSGQSAVSSVDTSSVSTATNSLTSLNACALLTDVEAQQVVPGAGPHTDLGSLGGPGTSSCRWTKPATNGSSAVAISTTVRPSQTIDEVQPNPNRPDSTVSHATTTGGRQAVVLRNDTGTGSCGVSIAVGSGRVDIHAALQGSTEEACQLDSKLSDFVEPRLPSS